MRNLQPDDSGINPNEEGINFLGDTEYLVRAKERRRELQQMVENESEYYAPDIDRLKRLLKVDSPFIQSDGISGNANPMGDVNEFIDKKDALEDPDNRIDRIAGYFGSSNENGQIVADQNIIILPIRPVRKVQKTAVTPTITKPTQPSPPGPIIKLPDPGGVPGISTYTIHPLYLDTYGVFGMGQYTLCATTAAIAAGGYYDPTIIAYDLIANMQTQTPTIPVNRNVSYDLQGNDNTRAYTTGGDFPSVISPNLGGSTIYDLVGNVWTSAVLPLPPLYTQVLEAVAIHSNYLYTYALVRVSDGNAQTANLVFLRNNKTSNWLLAPDLMQQPVDGTGLPQIGGMNLMGDNDVVMWGVSYHREDIPNSNLVIDVARIWNRPVLDTTVAWAFITELRGDAATAFGKFTQSSGNPTFSDYRSTTVFRDGSLRGVAHDPIGRLAYETVISSAGVVYQATYSTPLGSNTGDTRIQHLSNGVVALIQIITNSNPNLNRCNVYIHVNGAWSQALGVTGNATDAQVFLVEYSNASVVYCNIRGIGFQRFTL